MGKNQDIRRTGSNGRRSSCVAYNGMLYVSGITTVDLSADMVGQTEDVLRQIDKLLAYNNTSKHNVLSATVYLHDMREYGEFNSVWDLWVDDAFEPARTVVGAQLALEEYKVKVSLVAAITED